MIARRFLIAPALLCALAVTFFAAADSALAAPLFGLEGSEAGQVQGSDGLAVDRATGDVYVGDFFNNRVDQFEGSGVFGRAWGWGVLDGAAELQTCTVSCRAGGEGSGTGELSQGISGVAVDNAADGSSGDVYVVDRSRYRVQKFGPEGRFLLMFGGHVNQVKDATPGATEAEMDVCVAGEACTAGSEGSADSEFEWANARAYIAVGSGGRVYVGDRARVQVFEPSGAWRENISLVGLSATGQVTALAVDVLGDVYVKDSEATGVRVFEPGGIEKALPLDAGSETVEAISLDAAGDVFVEDAGGGVHFLEYGPGAEEISSFGSKVLTATNSGMVLDEALGELLVYGTDGSPTGEGVWGIPVSPAGPLIDSESVTGEPRGAVTFAAGVDPEGNETSVVFQYVDDAQYQASGFAGASSSTPVSIGSGFEDQPVEVKLPLKTLTPGATYHWRVLAKDTAGHTSTGSEQVFQETLAALVDGPWAANVASSSATLSAQINPLGASTEYRLEWGTNTSYGHTFSGNVGEGTGFVAVGSHIQGLEPGTTYHYRLVTTSEEGTIEGTDHAFTTQVVQAHLNLPDGRAWELVSPASKQGALIEPFSGYIDIQAAAGGGAIAYMASNTLGEEALGKGAVTEIISSRSAAGWRNEDVTPPSSLTPEDTEAQGLPAYDNYKVMSSDLSLGLVEQASQVSELLLSGEATERTPYLRNNLTCVAQPGSCYTPLVTPKDIEPSDTKFAGKGSQSELHFDGGTPDLHHVIVESPYALAKGAVAEVTESFDHGVSAQGPQNLYEWNGDGGSLKLVNVAPNGDTHPGVDGDAGACLGICGVNGKMVAHTVSSDGRWVVWSYGSVSTTLGGKIRLFVRDMVGEKTVQIGGALAEFQTMSGDGSRIFYRENGELYEFSTAAGTQTDLTAGHGGGEANAGVRDAILGAAEDGSYVYFVATGVLASGASSGADNLYVLHDSGSGWSTTFIATLSHEDEHDWFDNSEDNLHPCDCVANLSRVTSRVSPNGRFVTFMSSGSLTGYDNLDVFSGMPDEEVFLYDAVANRLVCASCNPTGARPAGVLDDRPERNGGKGKELLVDRGEIWAFHGGGEADPHWLAGFIPGWNETTHTGGALWPYQPRYLSDSGRLFFESPDALVPQATNGLMDVYEFEPVSAGDCASASVGFSARSAGCVSLISTGTGNSESAFLDASESGDDVFFVTASRLVPEDYDTAYDVYDARVCSAESPCRAAPVVPPPCSSGDSCKAAPSPQPAIFGAAPSATFSGTGNIVEEAKRAVKHKGKKPKKSKKRRKPKRHKKAKRSGKSVVSSGKGGRR